MSNSDYQEPTNEQLWVQPPVDPSAVPPSQQLVPAPQQPMVPPMVAPRAAPIAKRSGPSDKRFVLAIVSLALGIPLSAIGAGTSGIAGLLIAWVGIVLVNLVYGMNRTT